MGGIPTDVDARALADNSTVVAGLYAAGECACVSVHGANRLGTNSLVDIVVFGRRGGKHMAEFCKGGASPLPANPEKDTAAEFARIQQQGRRAGRRHPHACRS